MKKKRRQVGQGRKEGEKEVKKEEGAKVLSSSND